MTKAFLIRTGGLAQAVIGLATDGGCEWPIEHIFKFLIEDARIARQRPSQTIDFTFAVVEDDNIVVTARYFCFIDGRGVLYMMAYDAFNEEQLRAQTTAQRFGFHVPPMMKLAGGI